MSISISMSMALLLVAPMKLRCRGRSDSGSRCVSSLVSAFVLDRDIGNGISTKARAPATLNRVNVCERHGRPRCFTHLSATLGDYQPPKKYLTTEDLNDLNDLNTPRSYAHASFSGLEEDVDAMAATYIPEDYQDDNPSLYIDEDIDAPVLQNRQLSATSSTARDTQDPQQKSQYPRQQPQVGGKSTTKENMYAQSSLSFIAGIADPVFDDETNELPFSDPSIQKNLSPQVVLSTSASKSKTQATLTTSDASSSSSSSMSSQELRSKYIFSETEININFPSMLVTDPSFVSPSTPAVESSRRQDEIFSLQQNLKRLDQEITRANNGIPINLSSYKQVSQILFGTPNESTSKAVLEGMALTNILAKLILEYRQTQQRYNKLRKKEESFMAQKTKTKETSKAEEPLLLVDTSSFIFRAYYSMPPMHRADGMPVGAVLGFCNMLNRMILNPLLEGKQPRLVLCCDAPSPASGGPKTMRHELYHEYKANRQEAPMDLIPQFPLFRLAAQAYGMMWIEAPGYEADDVIASLADKALQEGLTVHIYSGDKDLMQLITNSTTDEGQGKIEMIDPMTTTHWDHDSVIEKWGVPAHQLGDLLALAGDTADNIPGVPGIGPKIAAQLLQQFGSLEEILSNLDQVPQAKRREKLESYRHQALLSQQLVRLERELDWDAFAIDFPVAPETFQRPDNVADLRMQVMNPDRILRFYEQMGFVTIKERLMERLQRQSQSENRYSRNAYTKRKSFKRPYREKIEVPKPEDFEDVPF